MLENVEIVPAGGAEPDTLTRFREAAGRWSRGQAGGASDTVLLACDLLVEGFDGPSLRDLASLPLTAGWWESRDLLEATAGELGLGFVTLDGKESRLLTLRFMCRAFLAGSSPVLDFLSRAAWLFEHPTPEVAHELAYLIYLFDADELELTPAEATRLAALAEEGARVFLAATAEL